MPAYLDSAYWLAIIWPILVATIVVATLAAAGAICLSRSKDWRRIVASVIGFALLGIVTGFLTGLSGESVVLQAVLPGVLSLVGGISAYLVSKNPEVSDIVAPSIGALAFTVLLGSLWGGNERKSYEKIAAERHAVEYLEEQAGHEAYIRMIRRDLGIPEEPPITPWPLPSDTE